MKLFLQQCLKRYGLYHRLKCSMFYDLYWSVANNEIIRERCREVEFYTKTLVGFRNRDLIFDIGANVGYKTDIFLRLGAQVVAVEPDEHNQDVLREAFLRYRLSKRPVIIVGKAVSDRRGFETMWLDEPGSAKNTLNSKWVNALRSDESRFGKSLAFGEQRKVETTTLDDLIRFYGLPFYIKIDVEGFELSVLRGLRTIVPYVSFEVNLPDFRPEALQCLEYLQELAPGDLNYTTSCSRGLALERWVTHKAFAEILCACQEPCIEVFWRSSAAVATRRKS